MRARVRNTSIAASRLVEYVEQNAKMPRHSPGKPREQQCDEWIGMSAVRRFFEQMLQDLELVDPPVTHTVDRDQQLQDYAEGK